LGGLGFVRAAAAVFAGAGAGGDFHDFAFAEPEPFAPLHASGVEDHGVVPEHSLHLRERLGHGGCGKSLKAHGIRPVLSALVH